MSPGCPAPGGVDAGETYQAAAARELAEELGVQAPVRLVLTYLRDGAISPYWLGVHEAVLTGALRPDESEIAWHAWLTPAELRGVLTRWPFAPDGREAFDRYMHVSGSEGPMS